MFFFCLLLLIHQYSAAVRLYYVFVFLSLLFVSFSPIVSEEAEDVAKTKCFVVEVFYICDKSLTHVLVVFMVVWVVGFARVGVETKRRPGPISPLLRPVSPLN